MQDIKDIIRKEFPDVSEELLAFGEKCYLLGQQNVSDFLNEQTLKKEERIKIKQKEFYDKLVPYVPEYGKEMIRAFYTYFIEPNKSMTKLKWELESTWDIKLRLIRWANNQRVQKVAPAQEKVIQTDRYK